MDALFPTLFAKTFFILGTQLLVTFLATKWLIGLFRARYLAGDPGITAKKNEAGEDDLVIAWENISGLFWGLLFLDVFLFLILMFKGRQDLVIGLPVFTLWSIITGFQLALTLLSVDENLGGRVLGLTALATFLTGLVGLYSGIDFSFLSGFLFGGLLVLIAVSFYRLLFGISRGTQRVMAFLGVVIFVLYLVFDFNRLEQAQKRGENSWPVAMDASIEIYLDVINLFLYILDAVSSDN